MKYSESLENFLGYLREVQQEYNIAGLTEQEANNATQDILHILSFLKISIMIAQSCLLHYVPCARNAALRKIRSRYYSQ